MQRPLEKRIPRVHDEQFAVPIDTTKEHKNKKVQPMNNFCLLEPEISDTRRKSPQELVAEYKELIIRLRKVRTDLNGYNINPDEL